MEYQLSNFCGNRIIKLIDKSRRAPDENRLPKSTKEGCKFLDVNEFPYMKFKMVPITNFQNTIYNFYYQPIIIKLKFFFSNLILMKNLSLNIETITHLLRLTANNMKVIGGMPYKKHSS